MDGKLLCEVIQGIKAVAGVEAFLVLTVATLHFAVVAWGVRADELVADAQFSGGGLEEGWAVLPACEEAVGELRAIVGLDTLHPDAPAGIPADQLS